tara:strand:+ start:234 stop:383 length:150 start_codon:yes stop_codon:yes gene_type:complete
LNEKLLKEESVMIPVKIPNKQELINLKKDRKAKNQFHQQAILYGVDMLK